MAAWKNRITGTGMVDPTTLNPNELNWRKHPDRQAKALSGTLDTLGWISDIIVNQQTGRMIDGHLRVELAIKNKEKEVPVKYVDLSPEEEELALLTLDPIGAMAEADKNMLEALLNQVSTDDERIKDLMGDIGRQYQAYNTGEPNDPNAEWVGMPEFNQEDKMGIQDIIVHFETREDVIQFSKLVNQENITDKTKYIWYPKKEIEKTKGLVYDAES